MLKYIIKNVPYIYGGSVPCCHVTSLRMILEYYGIKYSHSDLMNLSGFNYGFDYIKGEHWAVACPEFEPWDYMSYTAEKIGCEITFVKNRPWDETWELLKSYVNKDTPVYMPLLTMRNLWKIPLDIPHVVVLCGYDEEKGLVIFHDPQLGEIGEGLQYFPMGLPEGTSGSYAEFRIEDFRKACDLKGSPWEYFGKNALCVIKPLTERPNISWSEVINRNAKLMLGQIENKSKKPADRLYGPEGIRALADDLENNRLGLLEEPVRFFTGLGVLRIMAFAIGYSQRKDASAFIAGLAKVSGSLDLDTASYYLGLSGLCYEQGLSQIDYILRAHSISQQEQEQKDFSRISEWLRRAAEKELKKDFDRISELLRRAAEYDRKAGENLSKGAKAIK